MVEKMIQNGKVAVLYSGYGWSTALPEHRMFLMFDKGLVELILGEADDKEVCKYIDMNIGDDSWVLFYGYNPVEVIWIDKGNKFKISDEDGVERIEEFNDHWIIA